MGLRRAIYNRFGSCHLHKFCFFSSAYQPLVTCMHAACLFHNTRLAKPRPRRAECLKGGAKTHGGSVCTEGGVIWNSRYQINANQGRIAAAAFLITSPSPLPLCLVTQLVRATARFGWLPSKAQTGTNNDDRDRCRSIPGNLFVTSQKNLVILVFSSSCCRC
jgi:hypothetical protein